MPCPCGQHRTRTGCAGARYFATRTRAQMSRWGREGGKANAILDSMAILERYQHLDRDEAILSAWKDARRIQKYQRYRKGKGEGPRG